MGEANERQGVNIRLPASEVESTVLTRITRFLKSPGELIHALATGADDVSSQKHLEEAGKSLASALTDSENSISNEFIHSVVTKVEIRRESLTAFVCQSALRHIGDTAAVTKKFARRIGRMIKMPSP